MLPCGYLHTHILETELDERNALSERERETTGEKLVVLQFLTRLPAMPRGTPASPTIISMGKDDTLKRKGQERAGSSLRAAFV